MSSVRPDTLPKLQAQACGIVTQPNQKRAGALR